MLGGCTQSSRQDDEVVRTTPRAADATTDATDDAASPETRNVEGVATEGDNSRLNREEGVAEATTADDQSNDKSDVELTREIRRSLTEDDKLSAYAHNVKIIAENGRVVLKGPVRTAEEKTVVEQRARRYAGNTNVTSELTVVPR